jgi:hypothetical protein
LKTRPILFSTDMVQALLAGRKTMTRRIVKPQPDDLLIWPCNKVQTMVDLRDRELVTTMSPYGRIGDLLWVRETWALVPQSAYRCSDGIAQTNKPECNHDAAVYRADWDRSKPRRWRPSIHMPRWASRLTLQITNVRCERLQDIGEEDALAEGVERSSWQYSIEPYRNYFEPRMASGKNKSLATTSFYTLWDSIYGRGAWDENPWVLVIEFKTHKCNVDEFTKCAALNQ